VQFLQETGFDVTPHAYGISTAFEANFEYGVGGRLICFNSEYDALPGIGHACGHNLIAINGLVAFLGLTAALKAAKVPGRVRLLGTPAEEGGGGKVQLIRAGAYKGVDVCLMGHGGPLAGHGEGNTGTAGYRTVARAGLKANFYGKPAHAGGMPWEGINALDAVVSAYNNVSMLRQQIRPEERISACILETPKVSNVIPAYTQIGFSTRAVTYKGAKKLMKRIIDCLEGAALATGCRIDYHEDTPYLDVRLNHTINKRYVANMAAYGDSVRLEAPEVMSASTDMGNVTYEVPGLHMFFGIPCKPNIAGHHPDFTEASATPEAHASAVLSGKALALTGWDFIIDDDLMAAVRHDFEEDKKIRD
jgi:amidohydrolase